MSEQDNTPPPGTAKKYNKLQSLPNVSRGENQPIENRYRVTSEEFWWAKYQLNAYVPEGMQNQCSSACMQYWQIPSFTSVLGEGCRHICLFIFPVPPTVFRLSMPSSLESKIICWDFWGPWSQKMQVLGLRKSCFSLYLKWNPTVQVENRRKIKIWNTLRYTHGTLKAYLHQDPF